jgi:hypothetical protein
VSASSSISLASAGGARWAAAEVAEPGAEGVDAGRHDVVPEADPVGDERGRPPVVALALERDHGPLPGVAVPHVEPAFELLVTVADDVGLDGDDVAAYPLHREASPVHLGAHAVDRHPTPQVVGQFTGLLRHDALRQVSGGLNRRKV